MKKTRFLVIFLLSTLPLGAGLATRYYRGLSIHPLTKVVSFHGEIMERERLGRWEREAMIGTNNVRYINRFIPDVPTSHYVVRFDEWDDPVQMDRMENGKKKGELIFLYKNSRLVRITRKGFIKEVSLTPDIHLEYHDSLSGAISLISYRDTRGRLLYADHYFYRGKEITAVSVFSDGQIRYLRLYRQQGEERLDYKEKRYLEKKALFYTEGENIQKMNFLHERENLLLRTYVAMKDWDEALSIHIRGNEKEVIFQEKGAEPVIYRYRDNFLVESVYLKKEFSVRDTLLPGTFFSHDGRRWSDYEIWSHHLLDRRFVSVESYQNALLISLSERTSPLIETEEESTEISKTVFEYFPRRSLFRERFYLQGQKISERHFNSESSDVLAPISPGN